MADEDRAQALIARMLRRKLYAVFWNAPDPSRMAPHLAAHLDYTIGLEKQGLLFASGPFVGEGAPPGGGMTILRAENLAAARRLAEADPFVLAGVRGFEIREWVLNEGSVGLKFHFSDQSTSFT